MSDWGGTEWAAAGGVAAAAITFAAFIVTYLQLRQSRAENEDNRLTEKVDAAIGRTIQLINGLIGQARLAVEEAKSSAGAVQNIREDVEQLNKDLGVQREQIAQDRIQLEESLAQAKEVVNQLNAAAEQANQDAEEISRIRQLLKEVDLPAAIAKYTGIPEEEVMASVGDKVISLIRQFDAARKREQKEVDTSNSE